MNLNETAIQLECRKDGLDIAEYPLFRVVQVIYTLLSLASIPLLLYVQIKYIFGSIFHGNIKIVLILYYSMALLHSAGYSIVQIYEITKSLLVNKPCDFFLPTYIYIPLHLSIAIPHYGLVLTLLAICCERIVATVRSSKYESHGMTLGLVLLALVILGVVVVTHSVYKIEEFNVKVWSAFTVPPGAVKEFNQLSMLTTFTGFVCIIAFYVSLRINKKRCSLGTATLTSRYQIRENIITTEFASHIATLQVFLSLLHGACGLFIREFGGQLLVNKKLHSSLRLIFYVVPIFTVLLPIYSIYRLKYYRLDRINTIRSVVTMESRGVAGTRNYEEIIARSWQHNRKS